MPRAERQLELSEASHGSDSVTPLGFNLCVAFDFAAGGFRLEWSGKAENRVEARGWLRPSTSSPFLALEWVVENAAVPRTHGCSYHASSVRALVNRLRRLLPVADGSVRFMLLPDVDIGTAKAGEQYAVTIPPNQDAWKWFERQVVQFARTLESELSPGGHPIARGSLALRILAAAFLGVPPDFQDLLKKSSLVAPGSSLSDLRVTFNQIQSFVELMWKSPKDNSHIATGRVRITGSDQLTWELETGGRREPSVTSHRRNSIRTALGAWLRRFPSNASSFTAFWVKPQPGNSSPLYEQEPPFGPDESPYPWLEDSIVDMAEALRFQFSPLGQVMQEMNSLGITEFERYQRRQARKEQKRAEEEARRRETMARVAEERRRREARNAEARKAATSAKQTTPAESPCQPAAKRLPVPPPPVSLELTSFAFQETVFPLADLRSYFLRERAALWWVSNQSDDLLCLPHCRIEKLDYQLRTALRVLGPLRGRALLSDEVGLGKTIEAGLVLKELLTRGMVKKYLVLTVPSLVDQWAEELNDKFGLTPVTTNNEEARANPESFLRDHAGLVASLHTLKQPAYLEIARQIEWDLLIVDEAHYLRNRESQAWQAVNALPRHFLLLLTATPVQNSLEELYNLVTLLQPGQLPPPREFRARFLDPKRPRQPREPEELRRLLGQVMIRNTRANAGLKLPPRRAETVLFVPDQAEMAFWQEWEKEFRAHLSRLSASQSNLWGRLLLQAAGSSPAAWRAALTKFPDAEAARVWREQSPLEASWKRKCELLTPLAKGEGGVVVFTQFLETQAALAGHLRQAGVETFVINGSTPPPDRQPITEEFHKQGGALLLTHSGTEGRNLQFCHRLANFDLPWNPMEIEQRIGRLHRLGQQHPVRIYNFVQASSLQEHLLEILQEKLNLFELVVGETGLVLGEKFSSDEFAEEVLRRWRENDGHVAEAFASLGDELAGARQAYAEVKQLDQTLFAKDYESL